MFRISFFVDDKNVGEALKRLAGLAKDVEHAYVANVASKPNGKIYMTGKDTLDLLSKELHKQKRTEITGPEMRVIVGKLGFNPISYSYYLSSLVQAGILKKDKKPGTRMKYIVTGK